MSHLSAVAVGSDQGGSGHIHILSDPTEHRANTAEGSQMVAFLCGTDDKGGHTFRWIEREPQIW